VFVLYLKYGFICFLFTRIDSGCGLQEDSSFAGHRGWPPPLFPSGGAPEIAGSALAMVGARRKFGGLAKLQIESAEGH
jgi:hypothetical protein